IGFKLLKEEEESHEGMKVAASMREAIFTILIADFIMSTDNVLGVAGASNGSLKLLFFGLIFSMAILMWMGSLVANLINRFCRLAGHLAEMLGWTGETIRKDSLDLAPPGAPPMRPAVVKTRKEVLDLFDKNNADARAALEKATDDHLLKSWSLLMGGKTLMTM